jgi:HEAT repeat protein
LSAADHDVRLAAADALGKLRSRDAVPKLLSLYFNSKGADRETYLTALASIADPTTESLLASSLSDALAPAAERSQAAIGLARISSHSAVQVLWHFAKDEDSTVSSGCLSALQLCKDLALKDPTQPPALRLQVAATFEDSAADKVIRAALEDPSLQVAAAGASFGRSTLASLLAGLLRERKLAENGDFAEAAIDSLESTREGRSSLNGLKQNPMLSGFVSREMMRS